MDLDVVTVFGGSGFVGRAVVQELARAGARVRVACRRPDEALRCKPFGDVGQIVPVPANVRDDASVAAAVQGADAVVNLVGILYESGRQTFHAIHAEAPGRIAEAAAAAGVKRLVQISAIGADAAAGSAYARSKAAGEEAVRAAFPAATILRPSLIFGPEDGFFNRFAGLTRFTPVLPLIGGGHTKFQPVYIGDVAEAVRAVLTRADAAGRTYELGGPRAYTFRALLEQMLAITERHRLLVPVPFCLASFKAFFLEKIPMPLLTRDQVNQLRSDNVPTPGSPGLADLGIEPTALEVILPTYLARYRRGGVHRDVSRPRAA